MFHVKHGRLTPLFHVKHETSDPAPSGPDRRFGTRRRAGRGGACRDDDHQRSAERGGRGLRAAKPRLTVSARPPAARAVGQRPRARDLPRRDGDHHPPDMIVGSERRAGLDAVVRPEPAITSVPRNAPANRLGMTGVRRRRTANGTAPRPRAGITGRAGRRDRQTGSASRPARTAATPAAGRHTPRRPNESSEVARNQPGPRSRSASGATATLPGTTITSVRRNVNAHRRPIGIRSGEPPVSLRRNAATTAAGVHLRLRMIGAGGTGRRCATRPPTSIISGTTRVSA